MKLLRAYARFVDDVLKDYAKAYTLRQDAERLERFAEANTRGKTKAGAVNDKVDAVVVINSTGIITVANKNVHTLFGCAGARGGTAGAWRAWKSGGEALSAELSGRSPRYKRDELLGLNVNVLMVRRRPPRLASRANSLDQAAHSHTISRFPVRARAAEPVQPAAQRVRAGKRERAPFRSHSREFTSPGGAYAASPPSQSFRPCSQLTGTCAGTWSRRRATSSGSSSASRRSTRTGGSSRSASWWTGSSMREARGPPLLCQSAPRLEHHEETPMASL